MINDKIRIQIENLVIKIINTLYLLLPAMYIYFDSFHYIGTRIYPNRLGYSRIGIFVFIIHIVFLKTLVNIQFLVFINKYLISYKI